MLEETGTEESISTVKQVLYIDINSKATQQGRSHCSNTAIKKPDNGLQLHMGTTIILFREMSSGLMN